MSCKATWSKSDYRINGKDADLLPVPANWLNRPEDRENIRING